MKRLILKCLWVLTFCILSSSCREEPQPLQGYIDADYTYISSNFSGNLLNLNVRRGNTVNKGELLFILDVQPQKAQLRKAKAQVAQAIAQTKLKQTELDYQNTLLQRYQKLIKTGGISREEFDAVQNNYRNAKDSLTSQEANTQASIAELSQAQWMKSNKEIYSPISGYVYDTYYTVGELVPGTRPILALVAPENLKVVFYLSEPLLRKLQLNQTVYLSCDGCGEVIPATISYISSKSEYTPPYIFSQTTRTKFIFRIEAKPSNKALRLLHPGQPVSVNLS